MVALLALSEPCLSRSRTCDSWCDSPSRRRLRCEVKDLQEPQNRLATAKCDKMMRRSASAPLMKRAADALRHGVDEPEVICCDTSAVAKHAPSVKFQETVEVFYVVRESDSLLPPRRTSRRSMEDQSRRNLAQFAQNHQKIVSQMTSCLEGLSALVSGVSGAPRSIAA
mmetsp:Transcript_106969/g.255299  ORF Transcript_106969/g.255299 Transcript_106969/m.255299 type:complete len:168 (-) Transcript_106969:185-688(-)|eukprot:CAMPEP_0181452720 /NCGR_PEP_ID=MMETSP1110-20121109/29351_1 /TAXON_ID=174948 /ORGANISM="Symbiodinium sp., Strain CCMP421" /LENGTH=167 /DNA_ID=CAMNT_0023577009 /DNA_START=45 /DNA_END=548 /DNA_ORIENTATION=-